MDTIFMHSKNYKTFDPHRLLLIPSEKLQVCAKSENHKKLIFYIYYHICF